MYNQGDIQVIERQKSDNRHVCQLTEQRSVCVQYTEQVMMK